MAIENSAQAICACRAAAREAGIPWAWVVARKCELVAVEAEIRATPNAVRCEAWRLTCRRMGWAASRADWWAVGFGRCFPRITRTGEADFTSIPRYDEIASAVFEEWPEFCGGECDELWDWLIHTPYEPWPPRSEFYWRALEEIVAAGAAAEQTSHGELVPF